MGGINSLEAGLFEAVVELAEFGEGFDPGEGAEPATLFDELAADAGAAVSGVEDDAGEADEAAIESFQRESAPAAGEVEEAVASGERERGRTEDADSDGVVAVPKEGDHADGSELF